MGVETILERLRQRGCRPKRSRSGWSARCPAHDDHDPSLSIGIGDDGKILLHCFAGCSMETIVAKLGLQPADLFPPKVSQGPNRNGQATSGEQKFATADDAIAYLERKLGPRAGLWFYRDIECNLVGVVVRWDRPDGSKTFRQVSWHGDHWRIEAMPSPRPLYRLPDLLAAQRIIVCEGEKAADKACSLGFVATTSAGGAQAARQTDWRPLAGKDVWIFPDNDAPGWKFAETVAGLLARLTPTPTIRVVELPGLPDHGDIVDWIDAHGDAAEPASMRADIESLAQAAEPWRPDDADDLGYRPFPVAALPSPIRGLVSAGARAIGCDPSYLALPVLTVLAAAIGNTRRLELKRGWSVPPILWGAIVGESGTAKTPAFQLVLRPVRARQQLALERYTAALKQYRADRACWEQAYMAWKRTGQGLPPAEPEEPQAERFIVSDTTVEALAPILRANPRGLLLACDELAGWIGSFDRYSGKGKGKASADAAHWLSMFNAEPILVDRKTGTPRTIYVPQAAVCVAGGIQPGTLRRALGWEHRESGLAARLLVTCPPRQVKRWTEADIDPDLEAGLARLLDRLYELQAIPDADGNPQPVLVHLSEDAKAAWVAYYNTHAVEHADLTGDLAAAWSKLEEYAARIALVVHFTRWAAGDPDLTDPDHVDLASMNAGIALAQWFKHEARRVYAMLDESDGERDQRRLVDWIARKGGAVTPREVQQGCRWLKEPGAAEAALEELVKAGCGTWYADPAPASGGHSRRVFRLSTASTSTLAHKSQEKEASVDVDSVDAPKNGVVLAVRDAPLP